MPKKNLDLPAPFAELLEFGGKRGTITKNLCAALYWFYEELTACEREAALDMVDMYKGAYDKTRPKGVFKPGARCWILRNGLEILSQKLEAKEPDLKDALRLVTFLQEQAARGTPEPSLESVFELNSALWTDDELERQDVITRPGVRKKKAGGTNK